MQISTEALIVGVANVVVLVIVLPVLRWLVRMVKAATMTMAETNSVMRELKTVLVGFEGQGGLSRRVDEIAKRVHRVEQAATVLLMEKNMGLDDFKTI